MKLYRNCLWPLIIRLFIKGSFVEIKSKVLPCDDEAFGVRYYAFNIAVVHKVRINKLKEFEIMVHQKKFSILGSYKNISIIEPCVSYIILLTNKLLNLKRNFIHVKFLLGSHWSGNEEALTFLLEAYNTL